MVPITISLIIFTKGSGENISKFHNVNVAPEKFSKISNNIKIAIPYFHLSFNRYPIPIGNRK